jgi:cell wall assembly regulator SMI1
MIERLKSHWLDKRIRIRHGASAYEIESFESRYQILLPHDLREYFAKINGKDDGMMDEEGFCFLLCS